MHLGKAFSFWVQFVPLEEYVWSKSYVVRFFSSELDRILASEAAIFDLVGKRKHLLVVKITNILVLRFITLPFWVFFSPIYLKLPPHLLI